MSKFRFGLLNLLVVYFVWGSTFLAIRVAVNGDQAFSPFMLAALRVGIAGSILLIDSFFRREVLNLRPRLFVKLALSGFLFWFGGHALLIWVSRWAHSGYAALIFASIPLWTAVIEAIKNPAARSLSRLFPVLLGFAGILVLSLPEYLNAKTPDENHFAGTLLLLLSAFSWALGTSFHDEEMDRLPVNVSAGLQQTFAAVFCFIASILAGESLAPVSSSALWSLGYLVTFGSILAFSCFVRASHVLPNQLVSSFAFVNPLVAVGLGAFFLDEPVTVWTFLGMLLILSSVAWLFLEIGPRKKIGGPNLRPPENLPRDQARHVP